MSSQEMSVHPDPSPRFPQEIQDILSLDTEEAASHFEGLSEEEFFRCYRTFLDYLDHTFDQLEGQQVEDQIDLEKVLDEEDKSRTEMVSVAIKAMNWVLINRYKALVHKVASKKLSQSLTRNITKDMFEEMIQSGYEGILTAARRFDMKRKVKFITYAWYWINSKVTSCYEQCVGVKTYTKSSLQMDKLLAEVREASAGEEETTPSSSPNSEPAVESEEHESKREKEFFSAISLDDLMEDSEAWEERMDLIPALGERGLSTEQVEIINKVVSSLPSEMKEIVDMRIGFDLYSDGMSYQEIASRKGTSVYRVKVTYRQAMDILLREISSSIAFQDYC